MNSAGKPKKSAQKKVMNHDGMGSLNELFMFDKQQQSTQQQQVRRDNLQQPSKSFEVYDAEYQSNSRSKSGSKLNNNNNSMNQNPHHNRSKEKIKSQNKSSGTDMANNPNIEELKR